MQEENYLKWKQEIGSRLKRERLKLKKSRKSVAKELGFNQYSIKNFESDYPDIAYVVLFSRTYHVDLSYLIYGDTNKIPE